MARASVYNTTMYILAGLLVVGLILNLMIRPIADKHFMTPEELEREKRLAHEKDAGAESGVSAADMDRIGNGSNPGLLFASWAVVVIPLIWGVAITLEKASVLFK
jgi:hypothetical protein